MSTPKSAASSAPLWATTFDSPIGPLSVAATEQALRVIEFVRTKHAADRRDWRWMDDAADAPASAQALLQRAREQLLSYLHGKTRRFHLPLDPQGTAFQRKVWWALAEIPFGQTRSYGVLAQSLGHANAQRAVGAANGRNPLPIILPCHRVIGANGALTGFGGGLPIKLALLRLEGAWPA